MVKSCEEKIMICQFCKKEFKSLRKKKYCSEKCSKDKENERQKEKRRLPRKCKYCGNEFITDTGKKFCSEECRYNHMKNNPRHIKVCAICKKEFKTNVKSQKYCGVECQLESLVKNSSVCCNCGKKYNSHKHHSGRFCSRKCFIEYTGIKEIEKAKYKSNLTDASSIKRAKKYKTKYENIDPLEIFERDSWVCGICGKVVDKTLNYPNKMSATLDHIIPLSKGGTHTKNNVQTSHGYCNFKKSNKVIMKSS